MRIAEAGGCGAEVLASFDNGIIFAYTPGEPLDPAKYDSNEIRRYSSSLLVAVSIHSIYHSKIHSLSYALRIVAQEIAKFHHMEVPENDFPKEARVFADLKSSLEDFPEDFGTGKYKYSE